MTDTCTVCRFVPAEDGSDRCLACAAARTELDGPTQPARGGGVSTTRTPVRAIMGVAPAPSVVTTRSELTNTEPRIGGLDASADTDSTTLHPAGRNTEAAA